MSDITTARDEGIRLLQAGDMTGALNLLRQAVSQNPSDGKAYGYLGVCYARLGDYSLAVTALQHSVRLMPNDPAMRFNLGMTLFQAQRYAEAKPELELALSLNPNHSGARDLLGRIAGLGAAALAPPAPPPAPPATSPAGSGGLGQPAQPMGMVSAPTPAPLSTAPAPDWNPPPNPGAGAPPPMPSWTPTGATTPPPMPSWSPVSAPANAAPTGEFPQPGMAPGVPMAPGGMPPASGAFPQSPPAAGGLQYTPADAGISPGREPGIGKRLLRGWLWGIVYGQWWTLWTVISTFLWNADKFNPGATLVMAFIYGFFGSLTGIVIAATNAREGTAAGIGVAAGLLMMGLEVLIGGALAFINIIWYFFTGRYVGAGLAGRVHSLIDE